MMNNSKFMDLLQLIAWEDVESVKTGRIREIKIQKDNLDACLILEFPNVLDVATASRLITRLRDLFIQSFQFKSVVTQFEYKNAYVPEEILEEYFSFIVEQLSKRRSRFSVLQSFSRSCKNNEITLFVANQDEISIFLGLVKEVESKLLLYGIASRIRVEVSHFETSIEQIILENQKAADREILRDQHAFEQMIHEATKGPEKPTNGPRGKKVPRAKSPINRTETPLKKIPASETDVIEYRQQHGDLDFVIVANVVSAEVIERTSRTGEKRTFKIFSALVTDNEDSITIKTFLNLNQPEQVRFYEQDVIAGKMIRAFGQIEYDRYANDVVLKINDLILLGDAETKVRSDNALEKRVELHAHTKMTVQDGVMDVGEYVKQAAHFGHRALAVTDLHNVHVFPDFYEACKKANILPIFGLQGELVDEETFKIALTDDDIDLRDATYVVYDLETTGLSAVYNEIIEIAAAKVRRGMIIEEYSTYVKPKHPITDFITELTSITNDDVRNADSIEVVLPEFKKFIEGSVLVAHNATFDNGYLYENLKRLGLYEQEYPSIDTLQLAKVRYGHKLKRFNLKAVAKFFDVDLQQHHRAIYDTKATAYVFIKMMNEFLDNNITNYNQINQLIDEEQAYQLAYPSHFTMLSKSKVGKKNLYKIVSDSHTNHFHREPRILKKFLNAHREDLLIGSGCRNGEVFVTAFEKGYDELKEVMKFYDYIEVQPPSVYEVLVELNKDEKVRGQILDVIKKIISAAKEVGKIVVATGDVHHLNKEDVVFRQIYVDAPKLGGGTHNLRDVETLPSFHFMTTDEMLAEFAFLGEELAFEIVVTNTNKIADQIEAYELFPNKLFTPEDDSFKDIGIPSFSEGVRKMSYDTAKRIYGDPLPKYIVDRMEKELKSIIGNGFASIYYISHLLVQHSVDAGYVVGSRGSVGSSLIAFLMNITEVNPLPPHYFCRACHFSAIKFNDEEKKMYSRTDQEMMFEEALSREDTGYDLESKLCPVCSSQLGQDGVGIPFETFLGFKGDKVPDIDLNFSGEYQSRAHEFCRELFGEEHAFRVGTISTIADKTAYGYVKKYFEKREKQVRNAEINRLVAKVAGVKRSTGQHPGGIVVVPKQIEYTDIVPIQYPADDVNSSWKTTHFDYHKFETNLLKFDILGHDDPTMIRHLMNYVEQFPEEFPFSKVEEIPLNDRDVLKLFSGLDSLGLTPEQLNGEKIGTTGLPEFGTANTKNMLDEIHPTTVADLLKISGLSHGEGIWNGNSRDLLLGLNPSIPKVPFKDLIGCRDDIMVYLISKNVPANDAFKIMESVRKGRGVSSDFEKLMLSYNVPKWYIESCKLIKYMFPKAHATAYVIMALRIGWFKVHRPIFYYAAYFTRRTDAFDVITMAKGYDAIRLRVAELAEKIENKSASAKEIDTHYSLLLSLEMTARGYGFQQMDIHLSDATHFLVSADRKTLLIPFNALEGLGDNTAISVINARNESSFTSKRDIMKRTKINNTQFEKMNIMGVFGSLPEDDQIDLFNFK